MARGRGDGGAVAPDGVRRDAAGRIVGVVVAKRAGAWTGAEKAAFLSALAASANVKRSALAIGRSQAGAYQLRKRDAAFARGWDEAICDGFGALEAAMLRRAMTGRMKPVVNGGKVVVRVREYPDAMAINLLAQHRATAARVRAERAAAVADEAVPDDATARSLLVARLDLMAARLRGEDGAAGE